MIMLCQLSRVALVGAAMAGLLSAAVAAPARADTLNYDRLEGYSSYWVAGRVPGQPGNSHSGYLLFNGNDHEVELLDWRCSAAAVPPATWYYPGDDTGSCTLVRARYGSTPNRIPHAHGLLGASDAGPVVLDTLYPANAPSTSARLAFSFRQIGPTTTSVSDHPELGYRDTTYTAPLQLQGHVGWVQFQDPRTRVVINWYDRQIEYLYD